MLFRLVLASRPSNRVSIGLLDQCLTFLVGTAGFPGRAHELPPDNSKSGGFVHRLRPSDRAEPLDTAAIANVRAHDCVSCCCPYAPSACEFASSFLPRDDKTSSCEPVAAMGPAGEGGRGGEGFRVARFSGSRWRIHQRNRHARFGSCPCRQSPDIGDLFTKPDECARPSQVVWP